MLVECGTSVKMLKLKGGENGKMLVETVKKNLEYALHDLEKVADRVKGDKKKSGRVSKAIQKVREALKLLEES